VDQPLPSQPYFQSVQNFLFWNTAKYIMSDVTTTQVGRKEKKKSKRVPKGTVPKPPKTRRVELVKAALSNILDVAPEHSKTKFLSAVPEKQAFYRKQFSALVSTVFGTNEPLIKVHLIPVIMTGTSSVFNPTYDVVYSNVHDNAAWSTLFDEYQMIHGNLTYHPQWLQATGTTGYVGVGVIDYDDNTALTSIAAAWGYDTAKWFPLAPVHYQTCTWEFHAQGQPDLQWVDSSTTTHSICSLKMLSDQGSFPWTTSPAGRVAGHLFIRFRQLV
jgi:hypothetical protein